MHLIRHEVYKVGGLEFEKERLNHIIFTAQKDCPKITSAIALPITVILSNIDLL
jgi:hypothetical protein